MHQRPRVAARNAQLVPRRALPTILVAGLLASGCGAATGAGGADDSGARRVVVDFKGVFDRNLGSSAVRAPRVRPGLLSRVVVGPALSSPQARPRSHEGAEQPVVGHLAAGVLLSLLNEWGSTLMTPAAVRPLVLRACRPPCKVDGASWLEQAIWARSLAGPSAAPLRTPTAAIPVSALSSYSVRLPVTMQWDARAGHYTVQPRALAGPGSRCPDLELTVPVTSFSAEVIDLSSGRLALRVDESHTAKAAAVTSRWRVVSQRRDNFGRWMKSVLCERVAHTWNSQIAPKIAQSQRSRQARLRRVLAASLAPLRSSTRPAPRRHGSASPVMKAPPASPAPQPTGSPTPHAP